MNEPKIPQALLKALIAFARRCNEVAEEESSGPRKPDAVTALPIEKIKKEALLVGLMLDEIAKAKPELFETVSMMIAGAALFKHFDASMRGVDVTNVLLKAAIDQDLHRSQRG